MIQIHFSRWQTDTNYPRYIYIEDCDNNSCLHLSSIPLVETTFLPIKWIAPKLYWPNLGWLLLPPLIMRGMCHINLTAFANFWSIMLCKNRRHKIKGIKYHGEECSTGECYCNGETSDWSLLETMYVLCIICVCGYAPV